METKKPKKHHNHLTLSDRAIIGHCLDARESLRSIAKCLNKAPSTISREVVAHSYYVRTKENDCLHRNVCKKKDICGNKGCYTTYCKKCKKGCRNFCKEYAKVSCPNLSKPSAVCNGCKKKLACSYDKRFYNATKANREYRDMLVNRRNGFDLTCEEICMIDDMVSPLIESGLSPYHIKQHYGDKLPISESTLRKMIGAGELTVRNINLREQVKRRPRKRNGPRIKHELISASKDGHHYEDFLHHIEATQEHYVQMDCVEGKKEDNAVLLTLHFPMFHLQLAFIMNYQTGKCVVQTLDKIEFALGSELFKQVFPIILTDNGSEFWDIDGMERSINDGKRTKIFFCEPNRSDQKGACENNHKLIRYVIPKGTSLESYSQMDISLMMNNINSYIRKALFGKCPYDVAMTFFPEDFFILLGLEKIPPDQVVLSPKLLSKTPPFSQR